MVPAGGAAAALAAPAPAGLPDGPWRELQPGLGYRTYTLPPAVVGCGDGRLHVVRIDPAVVRLVAVVASARDGTLHTAAEWGRREELAVTINLGMYQTDLSSNVGYARIGDHVNNGHWNAYRSALGFGPRSPGLPPATIVDLDVGATERARLADYGTVVQNLRLIATPGVNRWTDQPRRWSEAALAQDGAGRLLFLFVRAPFVMADLNRALQALDLGVVRAMHLEGGPEASLSIHAGGVDLDLAGYFETGFAEVCAEAGGQWRIPNVLGVRREAAAGAPRPVAPNGPR